MSFIGSIGENRLRRGRRIIKGVVIRIIEMEMRVGMVFGKRCRMKDGGNVMGCISKEWVIEVVVAVGRF